MKIQSLYHFTPIGTCLETRPSRTTNRFRLTRRSGELGAIDSWMKLCPEFRMDCVKYSNGLEIHLLGFNLSHKKSKAEDELNIHFTYRVENGCRYVCVENVMFHFSHEDKSVDVCFLEDDQYIPNECDWEQGLENVFDQQIADLYDDAEIIKQVVGSKGTREPLINLINSFRPNDY